MSDLAATNCGGCTQTTTSGGCNCMWIILILLFCGGWNNNDGCGCGGGNAETVLMWRWMETGYRFGLKWMTTGILWEFPKSGWMA